jgi:hypothetical protein
MKSTLSTRLINTLLCALCLSAPLREASAAHYSKLGIITASKQLGRWPALKAWIAEAGYSDEWDAASFLSDDYPQFAAITNSICAAGIASSEEVAAILSASIDTAPDALLVAVYDREIKTEAGRVKWHGKRTAYREDTNTLTVVTTYADGWQYSQPFTVVKPQSLEARLAAAARQRANTMPPGLAATEAIRHETAATTNEVTVTVGPNGEVSVQPGITTSAPGPTVPTGNQ